LSHCNKIAAAEHRCLENPLLSPPCISCSPVHTTGKPCGRRSVKQATRSHRAQPPLPQYDSWSSSYRRTKNKRLPPSEFTNNRGSFSLHLKSCATFCYYFCSLPCQSILNFNRISRKTSSRTILKQQKNAYAVSTGNETLIY